MRKIPMKNRGKTGWKQKKQGKNRNQIIKNAK